MVNFKLLGDAICQAENISETNSPLGSTRVASLIEPGLAALRSSGRRTSAPLGAEPMPRPPENPDIDPSSGTQAFRGTTCAQDLNLNGNIPHFNYVNKAQKQPTTPPDLTP